MNFLSSLFSREATSDMCMEYKVEGMPKGVQLRLLDSTSVESSEELKGGVRVNFKGEGFFQASRKGKEILLELSEPNTPTFIFLDGEETMSLPKGRGHQIIKSGGGTVIRQTIS